MIRQITRKYASWDDLDMGSQPWWKQAGMALPLLAWKALKQTLKWAFRVTALLARGREHFLGVRKEQRHVGEPTKRVSLSHKSGSSTKSIKQPPSNVHSQRWGSWDVSISWFWRVIEEVLSPPPQHPLALNVQPVTSASEPHLQPCSKHQVQECSGVWTHASHPKSMSLYRSHGSVIVFTQTHPTLAFAISTPGTPVRLSVYFTSWQSTLRITWHTLFH